MPTCRYNLEFVLMAQDLSLKNLHSSLVEYCEGLEIVPGLDEGVSKSKNFKIHVSTEDPTIIFDICSQFGRLKAIKVDEHTR